MFYSVGRIEDLRPGTQHLYHSETLLGKGKGGKPGCMGGFTTKTRQWEHQKITA